MTVIPVLGVVFLFVPNRAISVELRRHCSKEVKSFFHFCRVHVRQV